MLPFIALWLGNPQMTGGFPLSKVSHVESFTMWCRHQVYLWSHIKKTNECCKMLLKKKIQHRLVHFHNDLYHERVSIVSMFILTAGIDNITIHWSNIYYPQLKSNQMKKWENIWCIVVRWIKALCPVHIRHTKHSGIRTAYLVVGVGSGVIYEWVVAVCDTIILDREQHGCTAIYMGISVAVYHWHMVTG